MSDRQRVRQFLSLWGRIGVWLFRMYDYVDVWKRPSELSERVRDFLAKYDELERYRGLKMYGGYGTIVLGVYIGADPLGISDAVEAPDVYVDYAERFIRAWESPAYADFGINLRIAILVGESFKAADPQRAECWQGKVSLIAERIYWRALSRVGGNNAR